jgi:isohexenylglutaconyl-CoA hydratase
MDQTEPPLRIQRQGAVTRATLNRPARRNALDAATFDALEVLLAELRQPGASRILVLSGASGHFCAGLDLAEMAATPGDAVAREAAQRARNGRMGALLSGLKALPQVVVALVEGAAHAGGIGLVCAADIALAGPTARFAAPEVRRGLVAAQILPWMARRMGHAATTRLVLQGHAMDATAALAAGLVHAVAADATALDSLLQSTLDDLVLAAPGALAETKRLLAALGPLAPETYEPLALEAFTRCAAGPEAAEGIAAFREKRPPRWAG